MSTRSKAFRSRSTRSGRNAGERLIGSSRRKNNRGCRDKPGHDLGERPSASTRPEWHDGVTGARRGNVQSFDRVGGLMNANTLTTKCCIVGGGPAGMMMGYLLARAGVDVVVLEKHADFLRD